MQPLNSQNSAQSDDLQWLAFRYVANELTADEAAAFEVRLADDQAVRDAVVEAVALGQAIMAVKPTAIPVAEPSVLPAGTTRQIAPTSRTHYYSYLALAVAACLLLAVGLRFKPDSSAKFANSQDPADAQLIAAAWSARLDSPEAGAAISPPELAEDQEQSLDFPAEHDDLLAAQIADDDGGDASYAAEAPSWMIDAVRSLQAGDGGEAHDGSSSASPVTPASLKG